MAASSVGYTMAVPMPSDTDAAANAANFADRTMTAMLAACTHMPAEISHFRPMRSERAPVKSWATAHDAG